LFVEAGPGELAGAAAAGVLEAAELLSAELLLASPPPLAVAPPSVLLVAAEGFAEEYRSLYQPEPLNCTAGAVNVFSRRPPQCGQVVRGSSENFWIFST
jgi:hypothetical protein